MFQTLPDFLVDKGYRNITDKNHTVHQDAWKTSVDAFTWLSQHPKNFSDFNLYMATQRRTAPTWLSEYPLEAEIRGWVPRKPLFVDVGGGIGHQCVELIVRYPELPGRIVLQDLAHCIDEALQSPGLDVMVHDMYGPQPIKGAKYYYMRAILHVLPDERCRTVLQNIKDAMSGESVFVIDEMVFPDSRVSWQAAQFDLTMMCAHGSMERTQTQWRTLLDSVDLKIRDTYVYNPSCHQAVMAVVL